MLKAIEARRIANEFNAVNKARAREFAANEIEAFIMPRITNAAKVGNYCISYFWNRSVFQDAQILPLDFKDALADLITNLGYSIETQEITQMGIIEQIRVNIDWRHGDE